MDCSPPGSSVHGILQARILDVLPFPSPGDLPYPGIEPGSPALQADFYHMSHHGRWCPREALSNYFVFNELLQDPDSCGQGPFGPRMYRMGEVDRIFQTPEMTLEAVISHALVNKGEQDLGSQASHTG